MSHGTQLDLFEPLQAVEEFKSALKHCSKQIAEMHDFFIQQQNIIGALYLDLKEESDSHTRRLSTIERSSKKLI